MKELKVNKENQRRMTAKVHLNKRIGLPVRHVCNGMWHGVKDCAEMRMLWYALECTKR